MDPFDATPLVTDTDRFSVQRMLWIHRWAPSLFSFRISRAKGYRFTPGQFARLGLVKENGATVWRAYSMVSAVWDEYLEFYSIHVQDGEFTSRLAQLEVGAPVLIERQAHGFFTTDRFTDGRDLWMLGTGTGLAPYLSILHDPRTWERFERLVLVHGVRETPELGYRAQIAGLGSHPLWSEHGDKLRYIPVITREAGRGVLHDRIPVLLANGELERAADLALDPARSRLMICGSPKMVEDTHRQLMSMGYRLSRMKVPGQLAVENAW
ncbi:ferredoxin--NADP reductase [Niveibacterium sp. SC-1]|uniref:ferredoxin--NADP reductase n=1 Tax=Niveibacterium sp. SC-1 TaxID=3135646 RepID=UPI00311D85B5